MAKSSILSPDYPQLRLEFIRLALTATYQGGNPHHNSGNSTIYAIALRRLSSWGFVKIVEEDGDNIAAHPLISPDGTPIAL